MNSINILVVDDDLSKIYSIIRTSREVISGVNLSFDQASSVIEAIEYLQKNEYHLLITDIQMPLRDGTSPDNNGGKALLKALYKTKNKIIMPFYVVGLTQFEELKTFFGGIWKVWHYDSTSTSWRNNLRDLIHHISLIKPKLIEKKIETLFVEGKTDKKIINKAIQIYYPEIHSLIKTKYVEYGGGSSWVERQLFIWAKSLSLKDHTGAYLKAVGLFDDDTAGRKSIESIEKGIISGSAERKTFSIIKCSYKHSILLKSIKSKGIVFPTEIEELTSIEDWKIASEKGWLVARPLDEIKDVSGLFKDLPIEEFTLKNNGFSSDEILIITSKINDEYKSKFCNYIVSQELPDLLFVKFLVEDILRKLKITF